MQETRSIRSDSYNIPRPLVIVKYEIILINVAQSVNLLSILTWNNFLINLYEYIFEHRHNVISTYRFFFLIFFNYLVASSWAEQINLGLIFSWGTQYSFFFSLKIEKEHNKINIITNYRDVPKNVYITWICSFHCQWRKHSRKLLIKLTLCNNLAIVHSFCRSTSKKKWWRIFMLHSISQLRYYTPRNGQF